MYIIHKKFLIKKISLDICKNSIFQSNLNDSNLIFN